MKNTRIAVIALFSASFQLLTTANNSSSHTAVPTLDPLVIGSTDTSAGNFTSTVIPIAITEAPNQTTEPTTEAPKPTTEAPNQTQQTTNTSGMTMPNHTTMMSTVLSTTVAPTQTNTTDSQNTNTITTISPGPSTTLSENSGTTRTNQLDSTTGATTETTVRESTSSSEGPGQVTATKEPATLKSNYKLLWILLPVLVVVVAALIFIFKYNCMKVHNHTDVTDNGTENASFQSRPESSKDGVMLLGVKSSVTEDNAAAR
ncbi:hypothetical protein UPYG_G00240780 [Umbra pygmaea]|uniref:Endomucin n=1 Tax=Umbra pygmaea TaxID=75934 RepID=A0ABD0X5R5_UMBPY